MTLNKDIDQVFKEGLNDYSENPPGFIWDSIEQNLNQSRLKRRRNIVYSIAASVALLISFGAGYMFTHVQENNMVAVNAFEQQMPNNSNNVNVFTPTRTTQESDVQKSMQEKEVNDIIVEQNEQPKANEPAPKQNKNESVNNNTDKQVENEIKEKTNIKKVNSGGTLLPPIYANNDNLQTNESNPLMNDDDDSENLLATNNVALNRLRLKNIELPEVESSKQLAYDDRLLFNPYDYALVSNKPEKDYSSWSVGLEAAPLVSYRDVVNVSSDAVYAADNNASYSENYDNEKPLTAYSAGVNVNYKVSKRLKIQSGIYYSEMGQISENIQIDPNPVYVTEEQDYSINTSVSNIAVKNSQNQLYYMVGDQQLLTDNQEVDRANEFAQMETLNADFVHTYNFYEIPLVVNYTVVDRKLDFNLSGGLSANILNTNNTYVKNNDERLELDAKAESINNFTYSGIIGLGFEYPIVEKLLVNLQPTFRYSLNSINNEGSVYPYSFGVYTGLRYNF